MAIYTDPVTGQRREVDDMARLARGQSWGLGLAVLILLAAVAWFYGHMSPTVDNTNTGALTITEPVTTPMSPNASPTQPPPSPNPGP
jgi:hypothetical protein